MSGHRPCERERSHPVSTTATEVTLPCPGSLRCARDDGARSRTRRAHNTLKALSHPSQTKRQVLPLPLAEQSPHEPHRPRGQRRWNRPGRRITRQAGATAPPSEASAAALLAASGISSRTAVLCFRTRMIRAPSAVPPKAILRDCGAAFRGGSPVPRAVGAITDRDATPPSGSTPIVLHDMFPAPPVYRTDCRSG